MFSSVSEKITQQLERADVIDQDMHEIYKFGFQQGLIILANLLTSITIGAVFGMISEVVVLLTSYIPLRSYAGGYHSNSSLKCYFISQIITVVWLGLIKFSNFSLYSYVPIALIGVVICLLLAPVEDNNKPLDDLEIKRFRRKTYKILSIEICICILDMISFRVVCKAISLVIFSEGIMLILGRIKAPK